ncbi:Uncharacterised protein [Mycobacterium tuberculosis]|nr:Uncharacterised protein [Mycobacterium tuberculosis]
MIPDGYHLILHEVIPDGGRLTIHPRTFFISTWWGRQDDFREIIDPIHARAPSVTIDFSRFWDNWKPV